MNARKDQINIDLALHFHHLSIIISVILTIKVLLFRIQQKLQLDNELITAIKFSINIIFLTTKRGQRKEMATILKYSRIDGQKCVKRKH